MERKYIVTRFSRPVIVTDSKEDATEVSEAVNGTENAEENIIEVVYIPKTDAAGE